VAARNEVDRLPATLRLADRARDLSFEVHVKAAAQASPRAATESRPRLMTGWTLACRSNTMRCVTTIL
jgi:hypothetical protein